MDSVTSEDIISKVSESERIIERSDLEWFRGLQNESGNEAAENSRTLQMRDRWGNWILIFIGLIIIFDILLVSFYGMGVWSFADTTVVVTVITDNFLKIFGLGFLITRETFKRIHKNS